MRGNHWSDSLVKRTPLTHIQQRFRCIIHSHPLTPPGTDFSNRFDTLLSLRGKSNTPFALWGISKTPFSPRGTACCIWSVISSQSPISISLVSFQRNVAKKTSRTRLSIVIRDQEMILQMQEAVNLTHSSHSARNPTYFSFSGINTLLLPQ